MGSIKQLSQCSQSVAERLKESTLKLQEKTTPTNGTTTPLPEIKSPYPVFTGQKQLNDEQLNQIRVIAQHLKELGLREAVNALVEETGCKIEHTYASQIRKSVKCGHWNDALIFLDKAAPHLTPNEYEDTRCELVMNKFLSLLYDGEVIKCVQILREEMPRYRQSKEFQELHRLIFYTPERLRKSPVIIAFKAPGYLERVVKTIENLLPSSFMLQEARLDQLLNKALKHQIQNCPYHMLDKLHTEDQAENILRDHICHADNHEIHDCQRILTHEANRGDFSPNGKYFITSSSTRKLVLYKCNRKTGMLRHEKNIRPKSYHRTARVTNIAWSSDSRMVAISADTRANNESTLKVLVYDLELGKIHRIIKKASCSFWTAVCFGWNSYKLAVADENGHFLVHDVSDQNERDPIANWEGLRIRKILPLRSGSFLALDTHNRIRKYTIFPTRSDETVVREAASVSSFVLHRSERYVLTNTERNSHLWDIIEQSLVRTYRTFPSKDIVIDSAFGGPNDEYFVTGAPDGRILIYNINDSEPLVTVKAHAHYINSISWHPKSGMFASVGADALLRVWHVGCEFSQCTAPIARPGEVKSEQKAYKMREIAARKVRRELRERRRDRRRRERDEAERREEEEKLMELTKKLEASETLANVLSPLKDLAAENRKRKKDRYNDYSDLLPLSYRGGRWKNKKRNHRKKRRSQRYVDSSMSMEVDDASNGKNIPSSSENGSIRSHL